MERREHVLTSGALQRDMRVLSYGTAGLPVLAFPCQDGMCDNWESFNMPEELSGYIDGGQIRLFCTDTVDRESWSDVRGDNEKRAAVQESYFHYVTDELVPFIASVSADGRRPLATGFSLGGGHAGIVFFRRPDLFSGVLTCSACFNAAHFWGGWMNGVLYDNSPLVFLENMPAGHPYIDLYNSKKIVLCAGQGPWERECQRTTRLMGELLPRKGIHAWVDLWGKDSDHDWPWWKKQIHYFLPYFLEPEARDATR